ncbi:hypothetical protein [Bradyrhizobium roseum]|uniref:hypothetical protein n=1 Tax=Bradyrhizobium roseum TaxID=3056648 RepID=UPI00261FECBD|nr:hypothetical protein [Bradyrhizobium roseus]WKA31299.1 hypothetical protein QUH67_14540 [Bradyrhizobium roseus]
MTNEGKPPPFKVRSTIPGRGMGLKEWSQEELSIASYQDRFPEQWSAYFDSESERGFITNAMNDHIVAHLEQVVPGLHTKHYRVGVIDFRFANERTFRFRMWQPQNRLIRLEQYWAYVREMQASRQALCVNGHAEWTIEQIHIFMSYLQQEVPAFWVKICEIYNEIGFSEASIVQENRKQAAAVFSVPEDIDYATIGGGLIEEADRIHHFEMLKPKNQDERTRLQDEWFNKNEAGLTFDEWRLAVRARKNGQRVYGDSALN